MAEQTSVTGLPSALDDEANSFWDRAAVAAREALAAMTVSVPAERIKRCTFCHAPYQGIRLVDGHERSDGMWVEHYEQRCCGRATPFRNHWTADGWYWGWQRRAA